MHEADTVPVARSFLIADIRGYSTFTRERGDAAAARLAMRFADLARDAVAARGGTVIELRGDEALAVFETSAQAVRSALELQAALREATSADPDLSLPVGIGIDSGEAVPVEGGYRGAALNLAARLCSQATAGQVLVSRAVADHAGDLEEATFEPRGTAELKGFDQLVEMLGAVPRPVAVAVDRVPASRPERSPTELDDRVPLVGRESELRWLRGTWRQARRGHGRVVLVSGPSGIGKTRTVAELASFVAASGDAVSYAGPGGAGTARALAAVVEAGSARRPGLYVLDDLDLHSEAVVALCHAVTDVESRPALVVVTCPEPDSEPALAALAEQVDIRGDAHRRLAPLDLEDLVEVARGYVADVEQLPAESMLRASGGVPSRVHEVVAAWVRDEASRRLEAAAGWLAAGREQRNADLDFANNAIALNLGRLSREAPVAGDSDTCPYRGLAAFEEADAIYFHGRERMVGDLAARVVGTGLLAVVGASGSGKSSLVMAGLLPSLSAGLLAGSERWRSAVLRPGEHPLPALEAALIADAGAERVVLMVDQFEEVFTTTGVESERSGFVDRLVELAADPERYAVVLTIRADFTGDCAEYPELAELIASNLVLVGPMSPGELRRAIELPARSVGLRVESHLAEALIDEVDEEPGALPLLSTALVELWLAREDGWLRLEAHRQTGGVRGAVARLAETAFARLEGEERDAARAVLLRLVGVSESGATVRRRVRISEFDSHPAIQSVLDKFERDRLLTAADGTVEVAHEALIREWPRLRDWLEEDAQGRELRAHITQAAQQWDDRDRDDAELYRGTRLSVTLDWAAQHGRELNELERTFLATSREASEAEAHRQRRTNRRLRGLLIGTVGLLMVALAAGGFAALQSNRAGRNADSARSAELSAEARGAGAEGLATEDIDTSLLLAVAGVRLDDSPATRTNLLAALQQRPQLVRTVPFEGDLVAGLSVTPDGSGLVTYDRRGGLRRYDTETWETLAEVDRDDRIPLQWTAPLAVSPGGDVIAAAPSGVVHDPLRMLDADSLRPTRVQLELPEPVRVVDVVFSSGGTAVAAIIQRLERQSSYWAPVASELLVWDLAESINGMGGDSATVPLTVREELPEVWAYRPGRVALSPDGRTAYTSRPLAAYDVESGTTLYSRSRLLHVGGSRQTSSNVFDLNPAGTLLAATENPDGRLLLIDASSGRLRQRLQGHSDQITALRFSHDGKSLASASRDRTAIVWRIRTGAVSQQLRLGEGALALAFSPDDRTLYSGGEDQSIRVWDLDGAQRFLATTVQPEAGPIGSLLPAPSGRFIAGWSDVGLTFYDIVAGRWGPAVGEGRSHAGTRWNSRGTQLGSVGEGFVAVWDAATSRLVDETALAGTYAAIDFSPDDTRIALLSDQGELSMLDAATLEPVGVPLSLGVPGGAVSLGPDGRALVLTPGYVLDYTFDHPSRAWVLADLDTGEVVDRGTLDFDAGWLVTAPSGRHAAITGLDGELVVLDLQSGEVVGAAIKGNASWGATYSRDGSRIITTGLDGGVSLWDGTTGELMGSVLLPGKVPSTPTFVGDSSTAMIATDFGGLYEWDIDPGHALEFGCRMAGRDLTEAEWRQHFGDRPWQPTCPADPRS